MTDALLSLPASPSVSIHPLLLAIKRTPKWLVCLFKAHQTRGGGWAHCTVVVSSSYKWWRPTTSTCVSLMPGAVRALSTYIRDVLQFFRILNPPPASMTMFYPCFALFGPPLLLHPHSLCSFFLWWSKILCGRQFLRHVSYAKVDIQLTSYVIFYAVLQTTKCWIVLFTRSSCMGVQLKRQNLNYN